MRNVQFLNLPQTPAKVREPLQLLAFAGVLFVPSRLPLRPLGGRPFIRHDRIGGTGAPVTVANDSIPMPVCGIHPAGHGSTTSTAGFEDVGLKFHLGSRHHLHSSKLRLAVWISVVQGRAMVCGVCPGVVGTRRR